VAKNGEILNGFTQHSLVGAAPGIATEQHKPINNGGVVPSLLVTNGVMISNVRPSSSLHAVTSTSSRRERLLRDIDTTIGELSLHDDNVNSAYYPPRAGDVIITRCELKHPS